MQVEADQTIQRNPSAKLKILGLLCLSVIILIAGATLLGIFVGKSIKDDTYKEAWVTYQDTSSTNKVIKERFILQGYELVVIQPGEMAAIFDMNKNHVVMQFDGMTTEDTDECLCMVFDMDRFTRMTLEDINAFLNQTYINVVRKLTLNHLVLEHTGLDVDPTDLSRKSLELCLGCQISKVNVRNSDDPNHVARKRSVTSSPMPRQDLHSPIDIFTISRILEVNLSLF